MKKKRTDLAGFLGLLAGLLIVPSIVAAVLSGTQPMPTEAGIREMEIEADQKMIREEALERLNNHLGSEDFDREGVAGDSYLECDLGKYVSESDLDGVYLGYEAEVRAGENADDRRLINPSDDLVGELLIVSDDQPDHATKTRGSVQLIKALADESAVPATTIFHSYGDDILIYEYVIGEFAEENPVQITARKKAEENWTGGNIYEVLLKLDELTRVPEDQIKVTLQYPGKIAAGDKGGIEIRVEDASMQQTEIFQVALEPTEEIYLEPSFPVWTTNDPRIMMEQNAVEMATDDVLCLRLRTSATEFENLRFNRWPEAVKFVEGGELTFEVECLTDVFRGLETVDVPD